MDRLRDAVLERQVIDDFLQGRGFTAQGFQLVGRRSLGGISRQPTLARFWELLGSDTIEALRDALRAANLGDAVFVLTAIQHDPYLIFRREISTRRAPDIFGHPPLSESPKLSQRC